MSIPLRLLAFLALLPRGAAAQAVEVTVDAKALEATVDRYVAAYLQAAPLPGVAFAFVAGDQVVLAKGYGTAAEPAGPAVDGATTRFRVASLSKPVVAMAVMQQVERGALDLHVDVNRYLRGFQVPDAGFGPITLHHLLTHTAGFDDRNVGRAARAGDVSRSALEYLAWAMPERVFAPGELCSYSNYGFALLGHVLEVATGMPFEAYMARDVLAPLGMSHSTFVGADVPELARGHALVDGRWRVLENSWDIAGAAANLTASADDLARFLVAQLGGGAVSRQPVLGATALATMQAQQHAHHPAVAGTCYGWFERWQNGWRLLEHGGHWTGYGSHIVLAPEARLGFLLLANAEGRGSYITELTDRLVDTFLADRRGETPAPVAAAGVDAAALVGCYRPTAFARHDLERITSLFATSDVQWLGGATIRFHGTEFVATEPLLFAPRGADLPWSPGAIAFRRSGDATYLLAGHHSFERVPWFDTVAWQAVFVGVPGLVFLAAIAAWLLAILRRRTGSASIGTGGIAALLGAVHLLWLLTLAWATAAAVGSNGGEFAFGVPPWAVALLTVPLAAAAVALLLLWRTVRAWRLRLGSRCSRLGALAAVLANAGWFALLVHWNLFGVRG